MKIFINNVFLLRVFNGIEYLKIRKEYLKNVYTISIQNTILQHFTFFSLLGYKNTPDDYSRIKAVHFLIVKVLVDKLKSVISKKFNLYGKTSLLKFS